MNRIASILAMSLLVLTPGICPSQSSTGTQPTFAELTHRLMQITPSKDRPFLGCGDVESVLKYGSPEDAQALFKSIVDKPTQIRGAVVVAADKNWIQVACDDGFNPSLQDFRFEFDRPLAIPPVPGQKINLNGTYASFTRDPFLIRMTGASISSQ